MNFEDSLDHLGGPVIFGGLAVLGSIAGITYYLPLAEATKMNVWGICGLTFLALAFISIVWWIAVMVVGVGRGAREAVRAHKARMGQLDQLDPAARARYEELANGPAVYYDLSGKSTKDDRPMT